MKKRLIALFISITFVVCSASVTANAEDTSLVSLIDEAILSIDDGEEFVTTTENSETYLADDTDVKILEEYNIERLDEKEIEKQNALIPYGYGQDSEFLPEIELPSDDIADGLEQLIENTSDEDELTSNHFAAAISSSKYDSRNLGIVSKVKDQGTYGTCWAHSALAAVETSVLKSNTGAEPDYSERHLAYFAFHRGNDKVGLSKGVTDVSAPTGNTYLNLGGNDLFAASRFMNSMGAADEKTYPYSKASVALSASDSQDYLRYVSGYYFIPTTTATVEEKKDTIKSLITQFGAVSWAYCSSNSYYTYNADSTAYYCNANARTNHAITVVGWDDNYSKYNFKSSCRPSGDGAWICKNSWGTNWGKNGYFYISYYDATIGNGSNAAVVTTDDLKFDNNYYYTSAMPLSMYNVNGKAYQYFTVTGESVQTLTAVSFMAATTNMPYSVQIYKNPTTSGPESGEALLKEEVAGKTAYAGYYSVDIPNVTLKRGDVFVVAIKCNGYLYCDSSFTFSNYKYTVTPTPSISYIGKNDIGRNGTILRINALTLDGSVKDDYENKEEENELLDETIEEKEGELINKQIMNCVVRFAGGNEYEYTGAYIKPEVVVYDEENEKLTEGIDYVLSYKNNRNSYEYSADSTWFDAKKAPSVTVKGRGCYEGEQTVYFVIKGKKEESGTEVVNIPMSKVKVSLPKNVVYTGGAITLENNPEELNISLSYMGIPLTEYDRDLDTGDYTITYAKNVNVGTATITFAGKGVYTGSIKKTFRINAYKFVEDDNNISLYMNDEYIYEKGGVKPEPEIYFKGELLKKGTDYTLSYKNVTAVNDGSVKTKVPSVVIRGKGNFTGSISRVFTIVQKELSAVTIVSPGKPYANRVKAYTSLPQLTDINGKKLSKGSDYDILQYTYVDDTEVTINPKKPETELRYAGDEVAKTDILPIGCKVLVTVIGKKNYTGVATAEFSMYSANISKAKIEIAEKRFNGSTVTVDSSDIVVKYGDEVLEEGIDYRVISYSNNTKPGIAKVTIWGIGKYGASKTASFKIIK